MVRRIDIPIIFGVDSTKQIIRLRAIGIDLFDTNNIQTSGINAIIYISIDIGRIDLNAQTTIRRNRNGIQ